MKPSIVLMGAALLFIGVTGPMARAFPAYYDISEHDKAQAEARQRNLPLAWLGSFPECLTVGAPEPGSIADLTQMALSTLQGRTVVIFFDGHNMAPVPAIIHAQYHIQDDGPLPNGGSWTSPKVVFSNPEVTRILGRVSYTQMKTDRDVPLNSALQVIRNDPASLAPPKPDMPVAGTSTPASSDSLDTAAQAVSVVAWISNNSLYVIVGLGLGLAALFFWLARAPRN